VLDCSNLHVHKPPWIAQPKLGLMLSHATVFVLPVRAMFDIGVDDVKEWHMFNIGKTPDIDRANS
jgi:hypothetical protein